MATKNNNGDRHSGLRTLLYALSITTSAIALRHHRRLERRAGRPRRRRTSLAPSVELLAVSVVSGGIDGAVGGSVGGISSGDRSAAQSEVSVARAALAALADRTPAPTSAA